MTTPAPPSHAGYRFPAEIISFAVWLYVRFPLSLRHVDEILAAGGIVVRHETISQPTRRRERQMKRFKAARQAQRFLSDHDGINNLFHLRRDHLPAKQYRSAQAQAFEAWVKITNVAGMA